MFRELLTIFRSQHPLAAMGKNFEEMLNLTKEMTLNAGRIAFGKKRTSEQKRLVYDQDVRVNQLERTIRKQVVAHLSVARNTSDVPYCLLLMSLVKDVERLGDYAKNLFELADFGPEELPEDELMEEMGSIRQGVEGAFQAASEVFSRSDQNQALRLIHEGRDIAQKSDALIERIARGTYNSRTTATLLLGTRYYKRIGGHLLNVLSSVVMPLHKIDYFDEDEIPSRKS